VITDTKFQSRYLIHDFCGDAGAPGKIREFFIDDGFNETPPPIIHNNQDARMSAQTLTEKMSAETDRN
jgi:hypothetical protein